MSVERVLRREEAEETMLVLVVKSKMVMMPCFRIMVSFSALTEEEEDNRLWL